MINRYPLWKNLIVVIAITLGVLYSLPNVYLPDYAVQVSAETSGEVVTDKALTVATEALDEAGIEYFGADLADGNLLLRFTNDDAQLQAKSIVQRALHDMNARYVVALNAAPTTPGWLRELNAEPMKYGLDLRGGVHFLMEVDTESVVTERMEALETDLKRQLREAKIRYADVTNVSRGVLLVTFNSSEDRIEAQTLLQGQFSEFVFTTVSDPLPGISLEITEDSIRSVEDFAVSQNLQTIRNRVNELGVAEPLVQRLGRNRIVVDLPGVQDTAEAKRILGKVATLEFRFEALPDAPRSTTVAYEYEGRTAQLERNIILRGDRVVDAQVGFDPDSGLPQVNISLDSEGGNLMHRATRDSIGRRLGVVFIETKNRDTYKMVDGVEVKESKPVVTRRVISLATVQAALGVKFRITGLSAGEARELSLLLRAGALAADMYIVEERTVGASLGKENVELGAISVAVGLSLVLIFMLVYYKVFGIAANIALVSNLALLMAVMSSFSFTLTLPGIAGIVLTVGMAVDANVLIFSRIREELANGMTPQGAINAGFDRASMFTAIMCTRAIINLVYGGRNVKTLAI